MALSANTATTATRRYTLHPNPGTCGSALNTFRDATTHSPDPTRHMHACTHARTHSYACAGVAGPGDGDVKGKYFSFEVEMTKMLAAVTTMAGSEDGEGLGVIRRP